MTKREFQKKLGENIVSLRISKGITQSELARRCFKERQSIMRLEAGLINPGAYYLKELADALEMDFVDFCVTVFKK